MSFDFVKMVWFSLVLSLLFLTGCELDELKKTQAEYFCKDRGGVYNDTTFFGYVYCNNGNREEFSNIVIEDEDYYVKRADEQD